MLSNETCLNLGLIKFCKQLSCENKETVSILAEYRDVFEGIGKFPGVASLEIDDQISPVIQKARRIHTNMQSDLKDELVNLENKGILSLSKKSTFTQTG